MACRTSTFISVSKAVPASAADLPRGWLARRAAGEPAHYSVGSGPFWGRQFAVTPSVLIPRPETELVVECALTLPHPGRPRILDVGTGSGILAIAARRLGAGRVAACDEDPVAVDVARRNAERNEAEVEVTGAALAEIPGRFDLVLANILAGVLVELAPALRARMAAGGELVLAGLLVPQGEEVRRAFLGRGLAGLPPARRGEWSRLRFRRPA